MECSIVDPEGLDVFWQIWNTMPLRRVRINYLYGARSDKDSAGTRTVANVAAQFIRRLKFSGVNGVPETRVEFLQPHCKATVESILGWPEAPVKQVSADLRIPLDTDLIIFPDHSAEARLPEGFMPGVRRITCDKVRDQVSGEIVGLSLKGLLVEGVEAPTRVAVVDDMCDGGRTFIEVARWVRDHLGSSTPISLHVTHAIFSGSAVENLSEWYDAVYYTNSYPRVPDIENPKFHELDIWGVS